MIAALGAGLIAGYGIAVPIGPVGMYLVSLAARTSFRVAIGAALGVATVDGAYAAVAVSGGAAVGRAIRPAAGVLHWVSVVVLIAVAMSILASPRRPEPSGVATRIRPARSYVRFIGLTLVNPSTLAYFVALVVGLRLPSAGVTGAGMFVAGAFVASASWQLLLAGSGAGLGRVVAGERARRWTAVLSATIMIAPAIRAAVT